MSIPPMPGLAAPGDYDGYIDQLSESFDTNVKNLSQQLEDAKEAMGKNPSDPICLATFQRVMSEYNLYRNAQKQRGQGDKGHRFGGRFQLPLTASQAAAPRCAASPPRNFKTATMNITNIQPVQAMRELSEIEPAGKPAALEDLLKSALADANGKASFDKGAIESAFVNPVNFSKPEQLIALQTNISDYNIYISLASTLTRKAVSAVETLVKAQ
jgi:type III secretion apparatus needle protein